MDRKEDYVPPAPAKKLVTKFKAVAKASPNITACWMRIGGSFPEEALEEDVLAYYGEHVYAQPFYVDLGGKIEVMPLRYWGTQETRGDGAMAEIFDEPVSQSVALEVEVKEACTWNDVEITIVDGIGGRYVSVQRPGGSGGGLIRGLSHAVLDESKAHFKARFVFAVDRLLLALKAPISKNLLYAVVKNHANKLGANESQTAVPLHLLLQRVVVLFPGILATRIEIGGKLCWPRPGGTLGALKFASNKDAVLLLASDADGNVLRQASSLSVLQAPAPAALLQSAASALRSAASAVGLAAAPAASAGEARDAIGGPYHIHKWSDWMNAGYPPLYRGTERLFHIHLQEYPYDWRIMPPVFIDHLLGRAVPLDPDAPALSRRPTWTAEDPAPSLRTLVRRLQPRVPFGAPRISLAGHSTGGVILNGLVRRDALAPLVDRAFFIGTPFQGAVKAYNAFLQGTMDLGAGVDQLVGSRDAFKVLGSNLATIYFLAPSRDYDTVVARVRGVDEDALTSYKPSNGAASFMKTIIAEMAGQADQADRPDQAWNPKLQLAADLYNRDNRRHPIVIGEHNCVNFYSTYKPGAKDTTYGCVVYDASAGKGREYTTVSVAGDGTVPDASLKASGLDDAHTVVIPDKDHVAVTDCLEVWGRVALEMEACDMAALRRSFALLRQRDAPPPKAAATAAAAAASASGSSLVPALFRQPSGPPAAAAPSASGSGSGSAAKPAATVARPPIDLDALFGSSAAPAAAKPSATSAKPSATAAEPLADFLDLFSAPASAAATGAGAAGAKKDGK